MAKCSLDHTKPGKNLSAAHICPNCSVIKGSVVKQKVRLLGMVELANKFCTGCRRHIMPKKVILSRCERCNAILQVDAV